MSARALSLVITTPLAVIKQVDGVTSFRASDDSGSFGVMPGHADLLSVLRDCVTRWKTGKGEWSYCALHGGVMTVENGDTIKIDIPNRAIHLAVDDATLVARRAAQDATGWHPASPRKRKVSKALHAYAALTTSAAKGAVRDISRLTSGQ